MPTPVLQHLGCSLAGGSGFGVEGLGLVATSFPTIFDKPAHETSLDAAQESVGFPVSIPWSFDGKLVFFETGGSCLEFRIQDGSFSSEKRDSAGSVA